MLEARGGPQAKPPPFPPPKPRPTLKNLNPGRNQQNTIRQLIPFEAICHAPRGGFGFGAWGAFGAELRESQCFGFLRQPSCSLPGWRMHALADSARREFVEALQALHQGFLPLRAGHWALLPIEVPSPRPSKTKRSGTGCNHRNTVVARHTQHSQ